MIYLKATIYIKFSMTRMNKHQCMGTGEKSSEPFISTLTPRNKACFLSSSNEHLLTILGGVTTAVLKHHNQNNLGREALSSLRVPSTTPSIIEGSQDRNSKQGRNWRQELMQKPWEVLLTGLLLLAFSVCFLTEPRTTSPSRAGPSLIKH